MQLQRLILLLTITVVHVLGLTEEEIEMLKVLRNHCMGESGVDEGLILEANDGNLKPDPKLKCYLKCVMISLGALTDDGVNIDGMIAAIPEERRPPIAPIIKKCGTVNLRNTDVQCCCRCGLITLDVCERPEGEDLCDTAFLTNVCYQTSKPENYFVI